MIGGIGLAGLSGFATPLLAQIAPPDRKLAAFCVGMDAYQHLSPLDRAVADAQAVGQRLESVGYRTEFVADAGMDAFYDRLFAFFDQLDESTAAFVFIAGHGVQVDGRNYLLPVDTPSLTSIDALSNAVVLDSVLAGIASSQPSQTIVILDACRNNVSPAALPGQAGGLASTNAPGGQFIAYSAGAGEYALDHLGDSDCSSLGLFARHFVEEITPGALIYDAIANTRARVIPDARGIGHSQHPAIYDQSAFPFRLDGGQAIGGTTTADAVGDLEDTGLVIAACHDYTCIGKQLTSPRFDADRVAQVFSAYGADVTLLREPDKQDVLDACGEMRARGKRQLSFYFLGLGGGLGDQASCFLPKPACDLHSWRGPIDLLESDAERLASWFEILSHGDILDAFGVGHNNRSVPGPELVTLFYDACLTVDLLSNTLDQLEHSRERGLAILESTPGVALLAASSMFQRAIDLVEGTTSSPFTIAMLNALAVPGLTMAELAARVRTEVETLTGRVQTPRLFGGSAIRDHVFVAGRDLPVPGSCNPGAGA